MIPEFWPARSFLEVEKAERTAAAVVVGAVAQQSFLTQHKMFGKSMAARYRTTAPRMNTGSLLYWSLDTDSQRRKNSSSRATSLPVDGGRWRPRSRAATTTPPAPPPPPPPPPTTAAPAAAAPDCSLSMNVVLLPGAVCSLKLPQIP